MKEAVETGSATLVTGCPHAENHFDTVARQRAMQISIVDLAEIIAQGL